MNREAIAAELSAIAERYGILKPELVLERARREDSALHSCFTWDDGEAAHRWRLQQAHELIMRVRVEIPTRDDKVIRVRAYTSLMGDRLNGGGYRRIEKVLDDDSLRRQLLDTALAELTAFRRRYEHLVELAAVIEAIGRVAAPQLEEAG